MDDVRDNINDKINEIVNKLKEIKDSGQLLIPDDEQQITESQEELLVKLADSLTTIVDDFNQQVKKIDAMMDEQDDIESKL